MKYQMAPNSLFAILLRSPWWISLALTVLVGVVARFALPLEYWLAGAMGAIPFAVIAVMAAWKQWSAPDPQRLAQTLDAVSTMTWRDFSLALADLFRRDGYSVESLEDAGADFCLTKMERTTLVSCKRWKAASQGVEPLRDLLALQQRRGAQEAWFVALGRISDQASQFARDNGIKLVQGPALAELLSQRA